jgi:hypothetical protein
MGKAGEKQKRRPKIKDKKQSERFREAARKLGLDKESDAFDRVLDEMARPNGESNASEKRATTVRKKVQEE